MTKRKSKDQIKLDLKYKLFVKKKLEPTFLQFIRYSETAEHISCLIFIVLIISFGYRQFY